MGPRRMHAALERPDIRQYLTACHELFKFLLALQGASTYAPSAGRPRTCAGIMPASVIRLEPGTSPAASSPRSSGIRVSCTRGSGSLSPTWAAPPRRVVAFYNQRGTAEQWIKEGKNAIRWTRLSCRRFDHNAVRLQLHALAYNLGNFMRTLALPDAVEQWSLTSLREKLIKIGAKRALRHVPDGRGCHSS